GEQLAGNRVLLDCDLVACSGGWSPVVHLHCHAGALPVWDDETASFLPPTETERQRSAGAVTGVDSLQACLNQGFAAGGEAARATGFTPGAAPELEVAGELAGTPLQPFWLVPSGQTVSRSPKQFVDFQNDTSAADIMLAVREGYESVQHVKRYTAMGFGTDQ